MRAIPTAIIVFPPTIVRAVVAIVSVMSTIVTGVHTGLPWARARWLARRQRERRLCRLCGHIAKVRVKPSAWTYGVAAIIASAGPQIIGGHPAIRASLFDKTPRSSTHLDVNSLTTTKGVNGTVVATWARADVDVSCSDSRGGHDDRGRHN
jgi:hypothetical protein